MRVFILAVILNTLAFFTLKASEPIQAQDSNLVRLNNFISQILKETPQQSDSIIAISNFLINISKESTMQAYVARSLFDRLYNSNELEYEAAAHYIAKNYFINEKLTPFSKEDLNFIKVWVEFTNENLVGMKAPNLRMESIKGDTINLSDLSPRYTLIYFYDDQCSICKATTPSLIELLNSYRILKLNLIAIYVESSKESWKNYIESTLSKLKKPKKWIHMWDPQIESNYQKSWGVLGVPKIYLLNKDGVIIGKNFDIPSLSKYLKEIEQNAKR